MGENTASGLGERLRSLREERGLTLTDAAEKTGLTVSHLHYIEKDARRPKPEYLNRLARFYGVLVEDLYALAGYTPAGDLPNLPAYLRTKYGLSDEVIREIENYKDFLTEREDERPASPQPPRRATTRRP